MASLSRLTLKGVLLRSAPGEGIQVANKGGRRAEPANTPLVEQAPMALVFVGRGLVGPEQRAFGFGRWAKGADWKG